MGWMDTKAGAERTVDGGRGTGGRGRQRLPVTPGNGAGLFGPVFWLAFILLRVFPRVTAVTCRRSRLAYSSGGCTGFTPVSRLTPLQQMAHPRVASYTSRRTRAKLNPSLPGLAVERPASSRPIWNVFRELIPGRRVFSFYSTGLDRIRN